jgi:hypothetical protein
MSEKEPLIRVHSPGQGKPSYYENTSTGEKVQSGDPIHFGIMFIFEAINGLSEKIERLEKVILPRDQGSFEIAGSSGTEQVFEYLRKHPEQNRPGGVIRCKSLNPLVVDEETDKTPGLPRAPRSIT